MKIQTMFKIILPASLVLVACGLALTLSLGNKALASPMAQALPKLDAANLPAFGGVAGPVGRELFQTTIYSCTLTYNTNNDYIGGDTFSSAAPLANYSTLALSPGNAGQTVPANPEYFYLDASPSIVYEISAIPYYSDFYNLGIIVYNNLQTPILSDTNPLNNTASVTFSPSTSGRYYFKIFQLTPGCKGYTYRIAITTITPSSTPTPSRSPTPSVPLTDTLEGPSGNGSFANAAAVSINSTYSNLTFYWNYPTADQDYYRVWTKQNRTYRAETTLDSGLDTYMYVYNSAYQEVSSNDDRAYNNYGSAVEWSGGASDEWYYIRLTNKDPSDPRYKAYQMNINDITSGPTATPQSSADIYEPNNTFGEATLISIGSPYNNLTFWPDNPGVGAYDVDVFRVWGKQQWGRYKVDTSGLDTYVTVYGPSPSGNSAPYDDPGPVLGQNDDKAYNDVGSSVTWTASRDGWYTIVVDRSTGAKAQGSSGAYTLQVMPLDVTITPVPTTRPGATPVIGYDQFEPNHNFDYATIIGLGVKYSSLNFVPYAPWDQHWEDNDFFKLRVKSGLLVTCETLDLSSGTDTNMILYRGPGFDQVIAGNDDVNTATGEFRSRVSYFSTYEGWMYILIGQGHTVPIEEASKYTYSFQCVVGVQATATPTPLPTLTREPIPTQVPLSTPTRTPQPGETPTPPVFDTPTPNYTPTPMPPVSIRPLPTATPAGPPKQTIDIELRVFYDRNENNQPDASEGVIGLQVQVYDMTDGSQLAQSYTDDRGLVTFSVSALGMVKVVVPYMNFHVIVPPNGGTLQVRVSPRQLPGEIP